jgi:Spy/CpxP family protein refolding chaperone
VLIKNQKDDMRKLFVLGMVVLSFFAAYHVQAADKVAPASKAVVEKTAAPQAETKTIFSFQKELGLTDKQVADIKTLTMSLKDSMTETTKQITALRQDLNKMVIGKEDIKKIRAVLQKVANIQVDNTCRDLEVSRKVEAVLTPVQWSQWKDIQEKTKAEAKAEQAVPAAKE